MSTREKTGPSHELRRLARLCGVRLEYWDAFGRFNRVGGQTLVPLLRTMLRPGGIELEGEGDAGAACEAVVAARWERVAPAVVVAWEGRLDRLDLRMTAAMAAGGLEAEWTLEDGRGWSAGLEPGAWETVRSKRVGGERRLVLRWAGPLREGGLERLPTGYHRLRLARGGDAWEVLVVAAPEKAWGAGEGEGAEAWSGGRWGFFEPLYGLSERGGDGAGDLRGLERLLEWTAKKGGGLAGTLPLMAAFLGGSPEREVQGGPFEPSPYAPASRLYLNEFYVDLESVPELEGCAEARELMGSEAARRTAAERGATDGAELVDWRGVSEMRRRVLEMLARQFYEEGTAERREGYGRFVERNPEVVRYAAFRAATERFGTAWGAWPEGAREGELMGEDVDAAAVRYHIYAQWVVHEQMERLAEGAAERGPGLYLDMPLGVNSDSYDVWSRRELFAIGAAGGAPPDGFFSAGQNWGFPPLHPGMLLEDRLGYFVETVRRLMALCGVLRIDHVMGLHRLYWVPQGMAATEGTYVRYPAEALYAVLMLESHRNGVMVVGEDLGTVPDEVREAMDRHGVRRMYVAQFSLTNDDQQGLAPVPAGVVASVNTHDTATWGGFLAGVDIDDRVDLGLLDEEGAAQEKQERVWAVAALAHWMRGEGLIDREAEATGGVLLAGVLRWLAGSEAELVLVNLEDLWLAKGAHNVPGTCGERPNWRRRAALPIEEWTERAEYVRLVEQIDTLRRATRAGASARGGE